LAALGSSPADIRLAGSLALNATQFGDPKNFPWTMGWQPTYQTEAFGYAYSFLLHGIDRVRALSAA
jgi:hypothetical protein